MGLKTNRKYSFSHLQALVFQSLQILSCQNSFWSFFWWLWVVLLPSLWFFRVFFFCTEEDIFFIFNGLGLFKENKSNLILELNLTTPPPPQKKNRRSIVVGCLWCCWIAWTLLIFFFGFHGLYPNKTELFEYPNCVASHPRTNSPPCQHQHGHVAFFTFASIFTTFFFLILLFIAYWTNSLVVLWWKELLCSRRILRLRKEESWNLQSTVNQYGTMNWER